jgi:hypothetical protein
VSVSASSRSSAFCDSKLWPDSNHRRVRRGLSVSGAEFRRRRPPPIDPARGLASCLTLGLRTGDGTTLKSWDARVFANLVEPTSRLHEVRLAGDALLDDRTDSGYSCVRRHLGLGGFEDPSIADAVKGGTLTMAIVKCAECGGDVSDKAPSCPKCGAPQAVTAPTAAPPPPPTGNQRRKTHPVTWAVFVVLVGVLFWYTLKSKHESTLPALPVAVQFRPAVLGPGLVLMFENKSDHPISFIATLQHPALNEEKKLEVYVQARATSNIGSRQGWIGQSGDRIELTNSSYQTWNGSIP